jgi:hypothetical protein
VQPIRGVGGTTTTCAEAMTANSDTSITPVRAYGALRGKKSFSWDWFPPERAKMPTQNGNLFPKMLILIKYMDNSII